MWFVSFTVVEYILVILHVVGKSHVTNVIRSSFKVVCRISDVCRDHDKCHIFDANVVFTLTVSMWRHDKQQIPIRQLP